MAYLYSENNRNVPFMLSNILLFSSDDTESYKGNWQIKFKMTTGYTNFWSYGSRSERDKEYEDISTKWNEYKK